MLKKAYSEQIIKYLVLACSISWLVFHMLKNQIPTDVGDGIMHFFIAQGSWHNPELFLHHWGKPFFILITSTFAQFGFNGMVVFNILVYFFTVLLGFRILSKYKVSSWLQALFPVLLLIPHDVTETIFGGLTEPLFNLAAMLSLSLLLNKKYRWFAIVVSLMPFMRSEGQLPFVLGLILLIYNKSYKSIPWLFFGFIIYAFIGLAVYTDFWWYFNKSAYSMNNSIYGKGTWDHYLLSYKNYLGNPSVYVLMLGIPSMLILAFKKRWKEVQLEWWFYSYGIFIGVVVLHSYFWATGQNGSLGLTRIATQGMPIFVLLQLYYISKFEWSRMLPAKIAFGAFTGILIFSLVNTIKYPKIADPMEKQVLAVSDYLKTIDLTTEKVYFHFPLLSFAYGENPYFANNKLVFHSFTDFHADFKNVLKPGDLIVRDSHFGPQEANCQLNDIAVHPELVILKEFISSQQVDDKFGEVEGLIVYQYVPLSKQEKNEIKSHKRISAQTIKVNSNQEYADVVSNQRKFESDTKISLEITARTKGIRLVYDFKNGQDYSSVDLPINAPLKNSYLFAKGNSTKLYFWNPDKLEGVIEISEQIEEELNHPVFKKL